MPPRKQIGSPEGLAALARMRALVGSYPDVREEIDKFGHTSFRIRNKPFVIMGENAGGPSLSVKSDPDTQQHLIRRGGFSRTRYIGQHGWVSVDPFPPDWDAMAELAEDAYLLVAPRALAAQVRAARDESRS
jgi:predicted DNA-binding protein (MmcQ/YjbR family)